MKCIQCQKPIPPNSAFCDNCGTAIPQDKKNKKKSHLVIWSSIALAVIAIITIVAMIIYSNGAYDRQIDSSRALLEKGFYKESVIGFDVAIKIDEKRPEGYIGKAEAMAYDPDMTRRKAEDILEVLEEGYKKSGDEEVLEHKDQICEILRENGFDEEADMISEKNDEKISVSDDTEQDANEDIYVDESDGELSNYMAIIDDCIVVTEKDFVFVSDKDLKNKTVVIDNGAENEILTIGERVYVIEKTRGALKEINPEEKTAKTLIETNPKYKNKTSIMGGGYGYIYIKSITNSEYDYDTYSYNLKTKKYELLNLPVVPDKISVVNGKIYFAEKQKKPGTEIISLYEANLDGSDARIIIKDIVCYYDIIDGSVHYFDAIKPLDKYINTPMDETMPISNTMEYNLETKEKIINCERTSDIYKNAEIFFTEFGLGEAWKWQGAFFEYHDSYSGYSVPNSKGINAAGKDFIVMDMILESGKVSDKEESEDGRRFHYYQLYTEDKKSQIFCEGEIISVDAYDNGRIYYRLYEEEDETSYERKYLYLDLEPLE